MKTVIEMAQEAGFDPHDMSADFTCNLEDIERFAELVRADEREACAKVCEEIKGVKLQGYEFAAAIRARGSNT